MAIYNKRIQFNKEKLIDHYLKRDSIPDYVYGIVRFFGIIVQNIYCVSSYLVLSWIVLFPISWIRSDLYSKAENYLYNSLLFIVSSWSMAAGATVVETGDEYKHLIEEPELSVNIKVKDSFATDKTNDRAGSRTKPGEFDDPTYTSKLKLSENDDARTINCDGDMKSTINNCVNQSGDSTAPLNEQENDLSRTNTIYRETSSCPTKIMNHNNNNDGNNFAEGWRNSGCRDNEISNSRTQVLTSSSNSLESLVLRNQIKKPRILLLCNHISTADVPLIMQSFSTLTNQSLLWVLDAQFKPTNFGLVCVSHGDFFIAKDSFTDGSLRDQVLKHPDRNLLVLFPEGGFWRKRLEGSNRYALKNGLPMTKYVTHPRFGAFKDLIDPSVEVTHIVDTTLLYDDIRNPLSILDIALGNRKEPAILNYKVYERSKINPTEEWLRSIWLDKDKLLQQYYEDRGSVYKRFEGRMRSAKLDWFKVLAVHLFYLLVCYLTIYRIFSATSVTMLKARDLYYSNI